jgi:hypothetical protein
VGSIPTRRTNFFRKSKMITIEHSAIFLASSILMMMALIVITAGAVVISVILHKYWKPLKLFTPDSLAAYNPTYNPNNKQETKINNK